MGDIPLVTGKQMLVIWPRVVQSELQQLSKRMELDLDATTETIQVTMEALPEASYKEGSDDEESGKGSVQETI